MQTMQVPSREKPTSPPETPARSSESSITGTPQRRYTPEADAACVAAVLKGERERFTEIIERYQDAVYSVALGYVRDRHAAEDVAQDVFINAYNALPSLRDARYFFPWLLQIARHRASQMQRRSSNRPDDTALMGHEPRPLDEPSEGENRLGEVMSSVEQLPEPYRQTVLLKYERNMSCKEIAAQEGVAVGTITSRLTRALSMLRTALTGKAEKR